MTAVTKAEDTLFRERTTRNTTTTKTTRTNMTIMTNIRTIAAAVAPRSIPMSPSMIAAASIGMTTTAGVKKSRSARKNANAAAKKNANANARTTALRSVFRGFLSAVTKRRAAIKPLYILQKISKKRLICLHFI